jgi:hypothetical protein
MELIFKALLIILTLTIANVLLKTLRLLLKPVPIALSVRAHLALHGMIWEPSKLVYMRNGWMVTGSELREALKDF